MNGRPPREHGRGTDWRRQLILSLLAASALALFFIVLWHAMKLMLLAFAALLLSILLRRMAQWIRRTTGLPLHSALIVIVLASVAVVAFAIWLFAPAVAHQFDQLTRTLPQAVGKLQAQLVQLQLGRELLGSLFAATERMAAEFDWRMIFGAFFTGMEVIIGIFMFPLVALAFAMHPGRYVRLVVHLWPEPHRNRVRRMLQSASDTLAGWLWGQLIAMAAVGIMVGIGLWLLGLPLALLMGILAAVLEFVPIIGPLAAAAPALLIALMESPTKALYVVLLFGVVQQLENHLLVPLVQKQVLRLPPALTIIALSVGAAIAGIIGILLATPAMALALVWVKELNPQEKS